MAGIKIAQPQVVSRAEWLRARKQLLTDWVRHHNKY
jgi:hypothetical protein